MNIQPDFKELLKLLEKHNVRYMIVGGYAVAFYGFPRFTIDLDIFYERSETNLERVKAALLAFGFSESDLDDALFLKGNIVKIGVEPVRVDLLNEIDGVGFAEAAAGAVRSSYDDATAVFIGREALVKNKRASGRPQDLADLENLT